MSARVLIVDDEQLVADNLQAFLEDEGMRVTVARSAEQAIELMAQGASFDVCVMDLRLPGMDGTLAIPELHRLAPTLRFVIHTGSASFTMPNELRALGIGDLQLFRKPVTNMGVVADTVRALVGR
jgi:DNA-binding NtrC family response regulator